ncbi:hypothetical protein AB0P21_19930 [Kribbella sp. NPDC056861]|uniref:hypothetical protein n=1 Tax=Kribbella sp. NPDC056861 TaxID=3154857 RepID=UPI00342EA986
MAGKTNVPLGVVIGLVSGWLATMVVSHAGSRLLRRTMVFDDDLTGSLPWVVLILAVAAGLGLLLSIRTIAGGALVGAGLLLTAVSLAIQLLPIRQAVDLTKIFEVPGTRYRGYIAWDGSILFIGTLLLVLGISRVLSDGKAGRSRAQDSLPYGQYSTQHPAQHPAQQSPQYPTQYPAQQPPQYPGQTFPSRPPE